MRYGLTTIAIYLFTGVLNLVTAQQQIFKNYTVNDGLVSNSVRCIFQDLKGFIWIGTWEGLSKYDGNSFTNYSTVNGLSHNMVNDLYESKDEKLYVALNSGDIDIIKDDRIINKTIYTTVINSSAYTPGRPVVVATDSAGLQEFKEGKLIRPKQAFPQATYTNIFWLHDSKLIAVSDSTIAIFTNRFELITEIKESYAKYTDAKVYQDSKNRIWICTYSGLKLLADSPQKNCPLTFAPLPVAFRIAALAERRVNAVMEDADKNIWFGTNGGLVKIKPDGSYQQITVKEGITSNIVTTIFQDKEMNIWFGTAVGISKLVTKSNIQLYPLDDGINSSDNMYILYPFSKNTLLIGTNDGLKVFHKSTGNFTPVANSNSMIFFSVVQNTRPPLLIAKHGLSVFDTTTLQYNKPTSIASNSVSRVIADKHGNFFLSNLDSLFIYNGNTKEKILNYRITAMLIDRDGALWAGTWQNGLFHLNYQIENNRFEIVKKDHLLPSENIRSLFEDSKGNIWAGTRYNGIFRITKKGIHDFNMINIGQKEGLSSSFVKGIREDAYGNLWIAYYQSLDKLIQQDTSFRIFNFSRINNYFASIIGMEMDAGKSLWLATGEGLTRISDSELEKSPPLPVYITKVYSTDSIYPTHGKILQLNYRQNQLQFEFSSPGFINEKQILYSYRLSEDSNSQWTVGSNLHTVSYASLRPGNYTFEVRTQGWNTIWGTPARFAFTIRPPFWQTWWFAFLCIAGIVLIIYSLIKKRIQAIQHEADMKQQIAETEMMALRAQMSPHFIFNCLNSIDNLIQMNEKEKATSYLSKFAKLIRSILENSKYNVVPCWKDMETLQLYLELEALRFDNKFSYNINISNEIMNGDYKVPPLVIQPFVENAIHHGLLNKIDSDKKLLVNVSVINNHILYSIEDNGVGRVKAASYKQLNKPSYESLGMQITANRINLFNQYKNGALKITDLYNEAGNPTGTKVEVTLIIQS